MGRGINAASMAAMVDAAGTATERRESIGYDEVVFVEAKRRECPRISWQALAEMTQRNVHDLRMRCDPAYRAAQAATATRAPALAEGVAAGSRPRRAARPYVHLVPRPRAFDLARHPDALALLEQLAGEPATIFEIRDALGALDCDRAKRAVALLRTNGLADSAPVEGWRGKGRAPHRYFLTGDGEHEAVARGFMEPADG